MMVMTIIMHEMNMMTMMMMFR